jgi:L-histidine Nalpha-methyltransferase
VSALAVPQLTKFALDVAEGLASPGRKQLSPHYFYDELGSTLFEAITLLPEYGVTRADERLLQAHSSELAHLAKGVDLVAELGSGSGRKTKHVLAAMAAERHPTYSPLTYSPIDVSQAALTACANQLSSLATVKAICADWLEGLEDLAGRRTGSSPMLLLFLGSSIGNLQRDAISAFLKEIRSCLRPGDLFLLGVDLVKDIETMLSAYDDATGVTAAFNLNLLARVNRELGADFDLRSFAHEVRWNSKDRCVEMHLLSCRNQTVYIEALKRDFSFISGETIWTESSHKFTEKELGAYAGSSGFSPIRTWVDREWPFAETLWRAKP